MKSPLGRADRAAATTTKLPALHGRLAETHGRDQPAPSRTRRIQVACRLPDGSVRETQHAVPDTPLFLDAVGAFARGTLIRTEAGPVAVEDLIPGDRLPCAGGGTETLVWIGSTLLAPGAGALSRVTADAFGLGRPSPDVLAGPAARLLHTQPRLGAAPGGALRVLSRVNEFVDGASVIEIAPPSPVRLYHIALARHAVIYAGGLEVESFHPGTQARQGLGPNMQALFLSLFGHVETFDDFGPLACPRLSRETMEHLKEA
ncbi:Hint domain-containing protein [Rhodosalinus sp. 5P4]|uniref:Hint domain-containing protein n=1 Tax=Rhodosalinus sp. 5P4 TaxID=3239196 RepID=UPI00352338CF